MAATALHERNAENRRLAAQSFGRYGTTSGALLIQTIFLVLKRVMHVCGQFSSEYLLERNEHGNLGCEASVTMLQPHHLCSRQLTILSIFYKMTQ